MMSAITSQKKLSTLLVASLLSFISGNASSALADLELSTYPLFLGGSSVEPNVMMILDDSGSMQFEIMPEEYTFRFSGISGSSTEDTVFYLFPYNEGIYPDESGHYDIDSAYNNDGDGHDRRGRVLLFDFDLDNHYNKLVRSFYYNKIYYNPSVRYTPWVDSEGVQFANATPTAAYNNPYDSDAGVRNLAALNDEESVGDNDNAKNSNALWVGVDAFDNYTLTNGMQAFWPAVYYVWEPDETAAATGCDAEDGAEAVYTNPVCYTEVKIRPAGHDDDEDVDLPNSGVETAGDGTRTAKYVNTASNTYVGSAARTDCAAAPTCTYAEEIQNFANWYTYYRSRILTSRAGIGKAFSTLGTNIRVGFSAINDSSIALGVKKFEDDGNLNGGTDDNYRSDWFDELYSHTMPTSGTPLRSALKRAGEYYRRTDNAGPWSDNPATGVTGTHLTCRQSYAVLMTDGYRNGSGTGFGNEDSTAGTAISGESDYSPYTFPTSAPTSKTVATAYPYRDDESDTLADVAMYYWKNDLRTDLDNKISGNTEDFAFWQHMVTFTVGLGVTGTLNPDTDLPGLEAGTTAWPDPDDGNAQKIDDMWHAAINSRGDFFSADDPDSFADALSSILANLTSRTTAAAAVALNAGSLFGGSTLYQARFDSANWTGQLLAYPIDTTDGSVDITNIDWDAGADGKIATYDNRKIVTFDGASGQPFRWANISAAQQTALASNSMLEYIRGSHANEEKNSGSYRNRTTLLGDIVNSAPAYLSAPSASFFDLWGVFTGNTEPEDSDPYSSFRSLHSAREPVIYVGSNAGMLHAIDPDNGEELAAFVPSAVIPNLPLLADPDYDHTYFVDGSPTVHDAFFNEVDIDGDGDDSEWHTVLVSGLRAGGQSVFAIDVTEAPNAADTEASLASRYLWEFDDTDDVDMGYSFSQPNVVRMANGQWAAVFGNGYNNTADDDGDGTTTNDSTTGNAVIYVVNIENGALIKKFDTGVGYVDDPDTVAPNDRPNGMGAVTPIDENGDSIVDYIYGGDLFGNVWKLDVTSTSAASWNFAYLDGSSNPVPLFSARAGQISSKPQPITTRIQVGAHPRGYGGVMLYFGTGQYFEDDDGSQFGQNNQSYYGIWDRNQGQNAFTPFNRNDLVQQSIIVEFTSAAGDDFRVTSDNSITWHNDSQIDQLVASGSLTALTSPDTPLTTVPSGIASPIQTHLGWYIDLYNTEGGNTNNYGEKQVSDSILRSDRVIFTTLLPSDSPCDFGGSSWLMELDLENGGRLPATPFDVNDDDVFSILDYYDPDPTIDGDEIAVGGRKFKVGIISTPAILSGGSGGGSGGGNEREFKYGSGSSGEVEVIDENPPSSNIARQSWIELFR
jgi:type IV pilus assembly protein PilY1